MGQAWDLVGVVIQMNVPQTHITVLMKLIVQTHKEVLLVPVKLDTMEMDTNVQVKIFFSTRFNISKLPTLLCGIKCCLEVFFGFVNDFVILCRYQRV